MIRVVQVGMGGWGLIWGAVVRRFPAARLVACVDSDPAARARAQRQLELPADRCFAALDAALDAVDCDAVLVATSLAGHVPVALAALAAGKHVLIEKPFAPSIAAAQQVVDAARSRSLVLMISQNYRFYPAARAAASLVRAGTLGPVGMVHIDFRRNANRAPRAGHRHYTIAQPLLMDMAIHHFDLMRMVIGQEPCRIVCQAWNPPWSNFADPAAAVATITFDGGAVVSYRGSWVSPSPQTLWAGAWRMECAGGEMTWTSRDNLGATNRAPSDRVTMRAFGAAARRLDLPALPYVDQSGSLAAFVQAIRSGEEPECSGRDNLRSLALMYAAVESAASGLPLALYAGE